MSFVQKTKTALTLGLSFAFGLAVIATGCIAQSGSQDKGSSTKPAGSGTKPMVATDNGTPHPALTNPSLANKKAPEKFYAKFVTTKGDIIVEVNRAWSPNGADRFYNLVDIGYYKDIAFFRAVPRFMLQFGVHSDPAVSKHWSDANIKDDPPAGQSNFPGYLTFAKTGMPNSRSAQIFINIANNNFLDNQGFTPFAKIVKGLDIVGKVNTEYGENEGEDQAMLNAKGNDWLLKKYPRLDLIKSVEFVEAP